MLIIDGPGIPKEADRSFWQRVREVFRCDHPEGYNVNPPAPMIIRPPVAPKAPPPAPNRCCCRK